MAQLPESQPLAPKTSLPPLQDVLATQDPLLLGLISHLIDSPLQEIIEQTTLQRLLNMEPGQLLGARHQLVQAGLIVYEKPLYQVLALELPVEGTGLAEPATRSGQAAPVSDILRRILGGGA